MTKDIIATIVGTAAVQVVVCVVAFVVLEGEPAPRAGCLRASFPTPAATPWSGIRRRSGPPCWPSYVMPLLGPTRLSPPHRPGRSQQTDHRDHVDQPVLAAAGSEDLGGPAVQRRAQRLQVIGHGPEHSTAV